MVQFKEGWSSRERHILYGISMMLAVFLQASAARHRQTPLHVSVFYQCI